MRLVVGNYTFRKLASTYQAENFGLWFKIIYYLCFDLVLFAIYYLQLLLWLGTAGYFPVNKLLTL